MVFWLDKNSRYTGYGPNSIIKWHCHVGYLEHHYPVSNMAGPCFLLSDHGMTGRLERCCADGAVTKDRDWFFLLAISFIGHKKGWHRVRQGTRAQSPQKGGLCVLISGGGGVAEELHSWDGQSSIFILF